MSGKSEQRAAQLAALIKDRDELEVAIESLIADMAEQPEAARREGAWAENGASTQRYLELTNRLSDVEQDIVDLTRTMAASANKDGPPN
ncbi:MAG: hypothetical protein JSR61_19095 [Proteobacteria bacterium]|nr:hypothetical protein [Pseudomonadota bacterium]